MGTGPSNKWRLNGGEERHQTNVHTSNLRFPPRLPLLYGNQILTVWSTLALANTFTTCPPPGPAAAPAPLVVAPFAGPGFEALPQTKLVTKWAWASSVLVHRPVSRSQVRIVLSSEAESRNLPFGWNTSARTQLSWPVSVLRHWPDWVSHSLIVLSREPVAAKQPGSLARSSRADGGCDRDVEEASYQPTGLN